MFPGHTVYIVLVMFKEMCRVTTKKLSSNLIDKMICVHALVTQSKFSCQRMDFIIIINNNNYNYYNIYNYHIIIYIYMYSISNVSYCTCTHYTVCVYVLYNIIMHY